MHRQPQAQSQAQTHSQAQSQTQPESQAQSGHGPESEPGSQSRPEPRPARAAASLLEGLLRPDAPPFALLRRRTPGRDESVVELLTGPVREVDRLADIPEGERGALALVPFRQIRERGFGVRDDGTPLAVLLPAQRHELPLGDVLDALPGHRVRVRDGAFDVPDEEYERIVRRVVEDEIATGEGANFVVRRTFEGSIPGFDRADALALFRRLLLGERGAYWTFVVHTGERVLIGASPEVHVRMTGGTVVMNPISGTYRYPAEGPCAQTLLDFLADRKESEELSMVVDEELKMMCAVGDMGGVVVGPRLKEMAHLAHTEYELRGRSTRGVREVLRETMFAATVTGSPVQNACRVIERHEHGGRGYYAGALALIGRDAGGESSLDSPILIRTADIDPRSGRLRVPVGATLVRASDPASEVAETHAKAAGVLTALGVRESAVRRRGPERDRERDGAQRHGEVHGEVHGQARGEGSGEGRDDDQHGGGDGRPLADDPRVRAALEARRADLAPFWLRMQTEQERGALRGEALVVDGEDTFTSMLAHLLRATGLSVNVRRYDEPGLRETALAHLGPVVLGPGPGDPRDGGDPRMRVLRGLAADLMREHRHGLLGVCLGHELLAAELGLDIALKDEPYQGAQETIELFGERETVGFYNSYTARCGPEAAEELALRGVELSRDPGSGDVHALRGAAFASVQFHPESVLTRNGPGVVAALLAAVAVG